MSAQKIPGTLQVTLTWMQAIGIALTIGGTIVYACVEIRIAVGRITDIASKLERHETMHERLQHEAQLTHLDLDRRLSRIEGANGKR